MAGSNQRLAFDGSAQNTFSHTRLFPVPEFADRGDAFVPRTTLNLRDYDMLPNHVPQEHEPCPFHLHWNWHWHWHLPSPPQQVQVEASHQTEILFNEPEDFLLYDYYDTDSDGEEPDQEDINVGGFDLEDYDNANNEANQCSLLAKQERVKALLIVAKRKLRGVELDSGSTTHCKDHEYALEDFQHCESPFHKYEVGKKSFGGYKRTVWEGPEGEDGSKRFCNDHEYIRKNL